MGAATGIAWTDSTFNSWWGCTKVGPACDHCYAEGVDKRTGESHWGHGASRRLVSEHARREPYRWQKQADRFFAEHGRDRRVFTLSMGDLFDNEVPVEWRVEHFVTMERCDRLQWQICTKRISNLPKMVPISWCAQIGGCWPRNIGVLITVVTQAEADRDIPRLLECKRRFGIPWVGISYEPAQEGIDFTKWMDGESGHTEERRGLRLSGSADGRIGDRRGRPCLEDGGSSMGSLAQHDEGDPLQAEASRKQCRGLSSGQGDDRWRPGEHFGSATGLAPSLRPYSGRADDQSRGWQQEAQPSRESHAGDPVGADNARDPRPGLEARAKLDWVIFGGKSGPKWNDRPFDIEWARSTRDQCAAAGTAFFMKQVAAFRPTDAMIPDDLMIRQFPEALS